MSWERLEIAMTWENWFNLMKTVMAILSLLVVSGLGMLVAGKAGAMWIRAWRHG